MTMWAERNGQEITFHANNNITFDVNYGITITENVAHLRHLWSSLGRLIEEAEAELREVVEVAVEVAEETGQTVEVEFIGEGGPEVL